MKRRNYNDAQACAISSRVNETQQSLCRDGEKRMKGTGRSISSNRRMTSYYEVSRKIPMTKLSISRKYLICLSTFLSFIWIIAVHSSYYIYVININGKRTNGSMKISPRCTYFDNLQDEMDCNHSSKTIINLHGHEGYVESRGDNYDEEKDKLPDIDHDCVPMGQWQLELHTNCNMIHEIGERSEDLSYETKLKSNGSYRETWLIYWNDEAFALKALKLRREEKDALYFDRHRQDAVVSSMLTPSKHIPNIYAHCANTGVYEYSSRGNMRTMIRKIAKHSSGSWSDEKKLRYAWQAAAAVSDLHNVGSRKGLPAISHTDLKTDQFIWIDGGFKLNDFNRAYFIKWNETTQKTCDFTMAAGVEKLRSPEEFLSKSHTAKIDVFALGNVLYTILTGESVFHKISTDEVEGLVTKGIFASIPLERRLNFTFVEKAIFRAMNMCFIYNVEERKSAKDVEEYLRIQMKRSDVAIEPTYPT